MNKLLRGERRRKLLTFPPRADFGDFQDLFMLTSRVHEKEENKNRNLSIQSRNGPWAIFFQVGYKLVKFYFLGIHLPKMDDLGNFLSCANGSTQNRIGAKNSLSLWWDVWHPQLVFQFLHLPNFLCLGPRFSKRAEEVETGKKWGSKQTQKMQPIVALLEGEKVCRSKTVPENSRLAPWAPLKMDINCRWLRGSIFACITKQTNGIYGSIFSQQRNV